MTRRETVRAIVGMAGVISGLAVGKRMISVEPIRVRRGDRVTILVRDNTGRVIEVEHGS